MGHRQRDHHTDRDHAHGPFTTELTQHYAAVARHVAVVAISHHQASTAPSVPIARVIHHGIDVDTYRLGPGDGGYVAFLGRMHPDKGAHRAIRIARAAGKKLLIAAKMWEPAERRYFAKRVEPLLGDDAIYIGQVGGRDKTDLLSGAEALINPIRWPEPFGLVMIEALASGTPVLAFAEGAAPEIVDHGRTGFLCADEFDMVRRLAAIDTLDRRQCRQAASDRFSTTRMLRDHLGLYHQLLAESEPITNPSADDATSRVGTSGAAPTSEYARGKRPQPAAEIPAATLISASNIPQHERSK